jgi:hypothetical protein
MGRHASSLAAVLLLLLLQLQLQKRRAARQRWLVGGLSTDTQQVGDSSEGQLCGLVTLRRCWWGGGAGWPSLLSAPLGREGFMQPACTLRGCAREAPGSRAPPRPRPTFFVRYASKLAAPLLPYPPAWYSWLPWLPAAAATAPGCPSRVSSSARALQSTATMDGSHPFNSPDPQI